MKLVSAVNCITNSFRCSKQIVLVNSRTKKKLSRSIKNLKNISKAISQY